MIADTYTDNCETCVVCFKNVTIFSIGDCDHPVCYECSTRMRVLCRQNECPICRQDMPKVIFTKHVRPFKDIHSYTYPMDKKFKICFESPDIQAAYDKLLEHVCTICRNRPAFRTFQNLKDHMRKEHELQYCDLCVENLNIFTAERRCYTRPELALHRRKGDPDDRSHRGHPLCEFCQHRYMDNDELFRHLRRDHLFCHFCDADGYHRFYSTYDCLREHFNTDHFLCEEGECINEKFTSVFRTEIDLKAHRALVHGRTMGKAAAKQARTLELEFTLAPRPRDRDRDRRPRDRHELEAAADAPLAYQPSAISAAEFPSLGEPPRPGGGVTVRASRHAQPPLAVTDENFPVLASGAATATKTVRLSVNGGPGPEPLGNGPRPTNLSIHVNHRPGGAVARLSGSQSARFRPPVGGEDFPSLPKASKHLPQASAKTRAPAAPPPTAAAATSQPKKATHVTIPMGQGNQEPDLLGNVKVKSKKKKAKSQNVAADPQSDKSGAAKTANPPAGSAKASSGTEEFEQLLKQQLMLQDPNKHSNGTEDKVGNASWKRTERKRSELMVGKLCQGEGSGRSDEQRRGLDGDGATPQPPPGFSGITVSRGPPPGFSVKLNSVARPQANRLTFTSSSGRSYPISSQGLVAGAGPPCAYHPPQNFEHRNEVLMIRVMNSLHSYSLERFREMSKKFRQGNMSAGEFYELCKDMMGHDAFLQIFPELIVLLPDITKQQELWSVHVRASGAGQDLRTCAECGQVISHADARHHAASHPAVSSAAALPRAD
ncbi:E3 ubiquitin-protein ligase ZNF598 [Bacillus rossius redtenbacheri]|uniref:E3 ubiquitin-protein ligase ZNF598 n=1 Tax=Bacillus rossius redtenbacheri TaxID=93214 RepID=UPI002FDD53D9